MIFAEAFKRGIAAQQQKDLVYVALKKVLEQASAQVSEVSTRPILFHVDFDSSEIRARIPEHRAFVTLAAISFGEVGLPLRFFRDGELVLVAESISMIDVCVEHLIARRQFVFGIMGLPHEELWER